MSRSPLEGPGSAEDPGTPEAYRTGWKAINRLMRSGYSWSGNERNVAFLNTGDGRFADVSSAAGLDHADDGRAAAALDWDHDGDLDLLVTNRNGPRVRFLRNDLTGEARSVAILLEGSGANPDAIGARVELVLSEEAETRLLVRARRAGEGFLAQGSAWLHFGLGEGHVESVTVRWPGGERESFAGVGERGRFVLRRGSGRARPWRGPAPSAIPACAPPALPSSPSATHVVLASPVPMPSLPVETSGGEPAMLFGGEPGSQRGTGAPLLVHVWASWCAPCRGELEALAGRAGELRAAGIDVVALSADALDGAGAERARAREVADDLLDELEWPYERGFVTGESLALLEVLQGAILQTEIPMPMPASFLVDPAGRAVAVGLGPTPVERWLEDAELLDADPLERRGRAVARAGRFFREPLERDLESLAARFDERGFERAAREYRAGTYVVVRSSRAELLHEFARSAVLRGRLEEAAAHLRRSIAEDPDRAEAHRDLGAVLARLGRQREAILAYRAALERDPEDGKTRYALALSWLALGERAAAERELAGLKRVDPDLAEELEQRLRGGGR